MDRTPHIRTFNSDADQAAFLLGGIGTGNVSLGARGELRDWEIFNHPGKGTRLPHAFFSVFAQAEGEPPVARVLEARLQPPFSRGHGFDSTEAGGLPRLESATMAAEYPFVWHTFSDGRLPVEVTLESFTPFVPLNPHDSGIPCAVLTYTVRNPQTVSVDATIVGSLPNIAGYSGQGCGGSPVFPGAAAQLNELRRDSQAAGLFFWSEAYGDRDLRSASMSLICSEEGMTAKPEWFAGGWYDAITDFWDDFSSDGVLEPAAASDAYGNRMNYDRFKTGSIGNRVHIAPGEERELRFILTWHVPNRVKRWNGDVDYEDTGQPTVRNHYATRFADAWEVGTYVLAELDRLERQSRAFHSAFFSSTIPYTILESASANITVLRSTTCFWLEDGTFAGWEGCNDTSGCCFGTCTHVWNYAQTAAFLFPSLERSMRRVEFLKETDASGKMAFRANAVFDQPTWEFGEPAADGQMGAVIRTYREWVLSGDREFLNEVWPAVKRALEFAYSYWDTDNDGVLDGKQHNTYDIEFFGPNPMTAVLFLAALRAGAELASVMGEHDLEDRYRRTYEAGSRRADEILWNGQYYQQRIEDVDEHKYQYGDGCLSDQLFGQFLAHVTGLGYLLPVDHVRTAVESIYRHNYRTDFTEHHNPQRAYVLNDERGLLLCTWPRGGRPRFPFVYSHEVWTGIEYHVAAHLIYEGFVDEGLELVATVRERHDGYRRNPWNEVECGHHYVRSMASWALLTAYTGFTADVPNGIVRFAPRTDCVPFQTFWSTGTAWGTFTRDRDAATGEVTEALQVLFGDAGGIRIEASE